MRPSRARSGVARTLSRREIEEPLDEILRIAETQRSIASVTMPD